MDKTNEINTRDTNFVPFIVCITLQNNKQQKIQFAPMRKIGEGVYYGKESD